MYQAFGMIALAIGTALFGGAVAAQGIVARGAAAVLATGPLVALAATFAGVALGREEWGYAFAILDSLPFAWLAWWFSTGRLRAGRAAS